MVMADRMAWRGKPRKAFARKRGRVIIAGRELTD